MFPGSNKQLKKYFTPFNKFKITKYFPVQENEKIMFAAWPQLCYEIYANI